MRTIKYSAILRYLNDEKIKYEIINKALVQSEYLIASLFHPVDIGFYFFTGNQFDFSLGKSLILANKQLESNENSTLVVDVDVDVQLLYYRMLNYFFSQKSTGTIDEFTKINSEAEIGKNVQIDAFTVIDKCKIGNNVIIGSNCKIYDNVVIDDNTVIESGSIIGTRGIAWTWNEEKSEKVVQPQLGGVEIGTSCILGANTIIVRGSLNENTEIKDYSYLAPGCRLGHGTFIGKHTHLANGIITGGNTKIGDYCFIGSNAVFRPHTSIDDSTVVGIGSVVVKNTTQKGMTLMGVPAKEFETKSKLSGMPRPKKNV